MDDRVERMVRIVFTGESKGRRWVTGNDSPSGNVERNEAGGG